MPTIRIGTTTTATSMTTALASTPTSGVPNRRWSRPRAAGSWRSRPVANATRLDPITTALSAETVENTAPKAII